LKFGEFLEFVVSGPVDTTASVSSSDESTRGPTCSKLDTSSVPIIMAYTKPHFSQYPNPLRSSNGFTLPPQTSHLFCGSKGANIQSGRFKLKGPSIKKTFKLPVDCFFVSVVQGTTVMIEDHHVVML